MTPELAEVSIECLQDTAVFLRQIRALMAKHDLPRIAGKLEAATVVLRDVMEDLDLLRNEMLE